MSAVLELKPIPEATASPSPQPKSLADQVKAAIDAGTDIAALTALYVKLRNAKQDIDNQAKAKTSPITQAMDAIEAHFLAKFRELHVDSVKTPAGTPYISQKTSVTVADNEAWLKWVLSKALEPLTQLQPAARDALKEAMLNSGAFAFLEARAAKTAVESYVEETKELPPGLNRRVEDTINVRAS